MSHVPRRLWHVQGFHGPLQSLSFRLPLKTSGKQIQALLQHLAARHLSPEQLVGFAGSGQRSRAFRPRVSDRSRMSLEIGDGQYRYVAQIVSEFQLAEATTLAS